MGDFVADGHPFEMPLAAAEEDYAKTPASAGSFIGATLQQGPSATWMREEELSQAQLAGPLGAQLRGQRADQAPQGAPVGAGLPDFSPPPSPVLQPDDYNKRFAPDGVKLGDKPLPESVARVLGQQKADEIKRESIFSRYSDSHSWATTFGTGLVGFMLDPVNDATFFLPGMGEETALAGLGRAGFGTGGAIARTAARVGAGALSGAAAQAPLSAFEYGAGLDQNSDYHLRDAFRDMMFGAAGGAILHAGLGGLGDLFGAGARTLRGVDPVSTADASVKGDAMRSAVSQIVNGREIDVAPIFDLDAANRAGAELRSWHGQQMRLSAETDAALRGADTGAETVGGLSAKAKAVADRLDNLRSDHAGFLSDIENARTRLSSALDTATPDRLAAIEGEIGQPGLSAARRQALEAEWTMLTEGAAQTPAADALTKARTEAEIQGLQAGAARLQSQIAKLEKQTPPLEAKAAGAAKQTKAAFDIAAARIESREKIVSALTARTIRRYAAQIGTRLENGEDAALAKRIISGDATEIGRVMEELRTRATGEVLPQAGGEPNLLAEGVGQFSDTARTIVSDTAAGQRDLHRNGFSPGIPQADFAQMDAALYGEKAPPVERPAATGAQAAEKLAEAQRRIEALGELAPEDKAELDRTLKAIQDADLHEQAYQQAGECLTGAFL